MRSHLPRLLLFALLSLTAAACAERKDDVAGDSSPAVSPEQLAVRRLVEAQLTRMYACMERRDDAGARRSVLEALEAATIGVEQLRGEAGYLLVNGVLGYAEELGIPLSIRLKALERVLDTQEAGPGSTEPALWMTRSQVSQVRAMFGDMDGAKALAEETIARLETAPFELPVELALARRDLAQTLHESGETERGRAHLERAVLDLGAADGAVEPELSVLRLELAILLELEGERQRAGEQIRLALSGSRDWLVEFSPPQIFESGEGWQWAWAELGLKLSFLEGREATRSVDDSVDALLEDQASINEPAWRAFSDAAVAALLRAKSAGDSGPGAVVVVADAYAGRLRRHSRGWLDAGRGGRGLVSLQQAAERGDHETVGRLLKIGVEPRTARYTIDHWRPGEPYLGVREALPLAAAGGHTESVRVLLATGLDPDHHVPSRETALAQAARSGVAPEVVQLLLEAGADPLFESDSSSLPLDEARYGGDYRTFAAILEASRSAGVPVAQEAQFAKELLNGSDVNSHWMWQLLLREEPTALHVAARRGPAEELTRLVEEGADPNAPMPTGRWRPIHWAAGHEGGLDRLQRLISAGANPNAATHRRYTPLLAAVQADEPEHVRMLLEAGAHPNAREVNGHTPLHVAARSAGVEVIEVLLQFGADVTLVRDSWTAVDVAEHRGHVGIVELLQKARDSAR